MVIERRFAVRRIALAAALLGIAGAAFAAPPQVGPEVERDAWRTAGNEEKYLEAYFLVEALDLQFARHVNQAVVNAGVA